MNARIALILTGVAFAVWETVDIFWIDVPAMAALFAVLFLSCAAWYWRRDSLRATGFLLVLFAFEAAVAPTLGAETVTKVAMGALAIAGIAAALGVFAVKRRGRSRTVTA